MAFIIFSIAAILGIALDVRYLIISLMVLFLLIPMAIGMIYIVYGFRKECSFNVIEHKLILTDAGLVVEFATDTANEDGDEDRLCKNGNIIFPFSCFGNYIVYKNAVVVDLKAKDKGFMSLPLEALDNDTVKLELFLKKLLKDAATEG